MGMMTYEMTIRTGSVAELKLSVTETLNLLLEVFTKLPESGKGM